MHTKNLLITLSAILLLASSTLYAKTPKEPCSTSVECDTMAEDLQGKINSVKAKGLGNLTREEYINYLHLKKKLLAVSKVRTAEQRKIIAQQRKIIAQENAKQAEMLKAQNKELAEMKKIFKEKTK